MSGSVLLILVLNIALNYFTTQENLKKDSDLKTVLTAKQIAVAIEQSQFSSDYVERQIAYNLRIAASAAADELDPDIQNISNDNLIALSRKIGVSHITLFVRKDDDIVAVRSSDPAEIGISTKRWDYWYKALSQLFSRQPVTVKQGQILDNFWSGPFEQSYSEPDRINKWGYYYDGKRNYMINPYFQDTAIEDYLKVMSPNEIVEETKKVNNQVLEITGINPKSFGKEPLNSNGTESSFNALTNQPIRFGSYHSDNTAEEEEAVKKAVWTGENQVFLSTLNGTKVIKSFVPIFPQQRDPYVIRIVNDYAAISSVVSEQLVSHIAISVVLLEIVILGSYILAGFIIRPVQSMLGKVSEVADGHFDTRLVVKSHDELGQLGNRINAMTENLGLYTRRLEQMYEENRSVKEYLESVINQTADAIHVWDQDRVIMRVNRAFEELYGWKAREVVGRPSPIVPDYLKGEDTERLQLMLEGIQVPPMESLRQKKDGTLVEVSISTSAVRDEAGEIMGFISVSRDITSRNRMEELLRRSEKLTTVGQLAAGVAHEIRNPLTTLRGFLQFQQETQKLNPQHIDLMLSELDRINLIVSEFLILAKPQAVRFQDKDLRFILGDVVSLLDSQAHLYDVQFDLKLGQQEAMVHCEENQLKQVFINVLKNSMEAMPKGGHIRMILSLHAKDQQAMAELVIEDEGIGIPADMMAKLGEPFLTNKESGTGLGLMVSQRIIQSHGGTLEIESEEGKGTKVMIQLPLSTPEEVSTD
ncbi:ATP-binding protein [Paenibacillus sp. JX-17]|uniref:histidine kinase n=1 Tax=Paenibacillus lacisoli TaxID=3064525 RepID=A0ABT9CHE0_9BACL|nr:ATP-binding protein [Paenibacillus sp. JX-17]